MDKLDVVKYDKFIGVYSEDAAWEIPKVEGAIALKTCTNFDINKYFKLKFREGRVLKLTGSYRNIGPDGSITFATKGNDLYRVYPGSTFTESLIEQNVGNGKMEYANIDELIYMTNNVIIRAYENNTIRALRSTVVEFRRTIPPGYLIELFKGRMFIAKEVNDKHLIIQSEGGNYERYDERDDTSFQMVSSKLTMLKAVEDGLFISSDKTYFLQGSSLDNIKWSRIVDYKAIAGTSKKVKGITVKGEFYNNAVIWGSERGICIGGDGGKFINLTEGRKAKSNAVSGCSFVKLGKINQYVVNTKG